MLITAAHEPCSIVSDSGNLCTDVLLLLELLPGVCLNSTDAFAVRECFSFSFLTSCLWCLNLYCSAWLSYSLVVYIHLLLLDSMSSVFYCSDAFIHSGCTLCAYLFY